MRLSIKKHAVLGAIFLTLGGLILQSSCTKDQGRIPSTPLVSQSFCDSANVKYSTHIQNIMVLNCATFNCHDGSGGAPGDLNSYAVLQGMVAGGQLQSRVMTLKDMPPTGPLPDSLLKQLQCWIDDGAPNN